MIICINLFTDFFFSRAVHLYFQYEQIYLHVELFGVLPFERISITLSFINLYHLKLLMLAKCMLPAKIFLYLR